MRWIALTLLLICSTPVLLSEEQKGQASWYGGKYHGRTTASGEIFNTYDLTAAHRTLPFDTLVEVTNLGNGKSVTVRINDRGPFVDNRIIDLSYEAAQKLDFVQQGVADVSIRWGEMEEEPTFLIQVGAFSNLENAIHLKSKLEEQGYTPVSELSNKGIVRIFLQEIPESRTFETVKTLEKLGITDMMIRQN